MGFQKLLDGIGLVLMVAALLSFFFGFGIWFSPVVVFDLGAALYMAPRILAEWLAP